MGRNPVLYLIGCMLLVSLTKVSGRVNTPPEIFFKREWRLPENEEIGSVVDRLTVFDEEGDQVSLSLDHPISTMANTLKEGYKLFTIDDQMRVLLAESLQGMAGETFLLGIKASDGKIRNRVDVKVTVVKPNENRSHLSSLAKAFAPGPAHPSFIGNVPRMPLPEPGPPLLNIDQNTVWEIMSNDTLGTPISTIEAHDLTSTYLNLTVTPDDLVEIDSKSGRVIVSAILTNQVGDHKLQITASNKYASLSEEVTLRVLPAGASSIPTTTIASVLVDSQLPKNKFDTLPENYYDGDVTASPKPRFTIIEKGIPEEKVPSKSTGKEANWTIVLLVLGLGVVPVFLVIIFFIYRWKCGAKLDTKRKDISVRYSGKDESPGILEFNPRDNIIADILSAVGIHRRADNNIYENGVKKPKAPSRLNSKFKKSIPPFEGDQWEFPRHKLRFVGILGEGCFGQVWKCEAANEKWNSSESSFVAVKTLKESSGSEELRDLIQELKVLKALGSHPNVVSLLGCCTEKEPIFMILEYMIGGKLQSYLRSSRTNCAYNNLHVPSGSLTPRDLTIFALQTAKGMDFLSKNYIVHRDLAARNILVGEDKICKVADFGFARDVANNHVYERKSDGRLPIRWMAPESLYDNVFTTKSDVWSFGILLWEIVTLGSIPYPGMSAEEVMRKVKEGFRLEKPDHCRREIYNIMYYCWDVEARERPNFGELIKTLESLISTEVDYIRLDNFPDHNYYNFNTVTASGELL